MTNLTFSFQSLLLSIHLWTGSQHSCSVAKHQFESFTLTFLLFLPARILLMFGLVEFTFSVEVNPNENWETDFLVDHYLRWKFIEQISIFFLFQSIVERSENGVGIHIRVACSQYEPARSCRFRFGTKRSVHQEWVSFHCR